MADQLDPLVQSIERKCEASVSDLTAKYLGIPLSHAEELVVKGKNPYMGGWTATFSLERPSESEYKVSVSLATPLMTQMDIVTQVLNKLFNGKIIELAKKKETRAEFQVPPQEVPDKWKMDVGAPTKILWESDWLKPDRWLPEIPWKG